MAKNTLSEGLSLAGKSCIVTGGVGPKNLKDYLALPAVLACGGSWMVDPKLVRAGRFDEIERLTAVDRKTIRRCAQELVAAANSPGVATGSHGRGSEFLGDQIPPPRPPARAPKIARSACEEHRDWIEQQVVLGRNAQAIYQDLVERFGFTHRYNSVKRFVRSMRAHEPERFDILDAAPGEEAQVDFGLGAPTLYRSGRYRRPYLFVMTLKYSGKAFRHVVWRADQQTWARLHEQAFRALGGAVSYVVLDNLKQGVIKPDLYEPALNPVYAAMLAHYSAVADVARVADPNRKGTVERAIQHTQDTALGGRMQVTQQQMSFLEGLRLARTGRAGSAPLAAAGSTLCPLGAS